MWRNMFGGRDSTCVSQRAGDVPANLRTSSACRTDDSTYAPPKFAQKMFQVKEGSHTVERHPHCSIHSNPSISTKTGKSALQTPVLVKATSFAMGACGSTANMSWPMEINSPRVVQEGHNRTSTSSLISDLEHMELLRGLGWWNSRSRAQAGSREREVSRLRVIRLARWHYIVKRWSVIQE